MLIIDIEKLNETIEKQDVKINELELDIDNYKLLYNELINAG